jgi:succinoglycan biosynthesis transport protein ExoP
MDKSSILLSVLKRRMLPAMMTFASVMVAAIAYLAFTPRLYEATARLMLNDNQLSVSDLGRDLGRLPSAAAGGPNPLATQSELLKSQRVLKRAIRKLPFKEDTLTVHQISQELRVRIVPGTNILELSYRDKNPKLAAALLNAATAAMVEENIANIRAGASSVRAFLETEVPKQRTVLEEVEARENRYRQENGLISVAEQTQELVQSLGAVENQERDLSSQLQDLTSQHLSLQQLVGTASSKKAYTSARVGQDEELKALRTKLADLAAQVIEMRSRLGDQHPDLIALTEQRDETQKLYESKRSRIMPAEQSSTSDVAGDALSQELMAKLIASDIERVALEQKLGVVRTSRLNLQSRLIELPIKQQPLTTLIRTREEAESTLKQLQSKLQEARIAEAQLISNINIISVAESPTQPQWPKKSAVLVMAVVFGTALSTGIILLLEVLDGSLYDAGAAEEIFGQPPLGALPPLYSTLMDLSQPELFLDNVYSVEPYRKLLKTLEFRTAKKLRLLAISSALANEGKSAVVSHLAVVSALSSQRTLIIDADLRRPKQHKLFRLSLEPGLAEVIDGKLTLQEAIQTTSCERLSVLTCGNRSQRPSIVLESAAMQSLLQAAANQFDLVILDTPPINSYADAFVLSRYSDGLMFVVRPGTTTRNGLSQAVREQSKSGVEFIGFVLNNMDSPIERDYFDSKNGSKRFPNFLRGLPLSKAPQELSAVNAERKAVS